MEMTNIEKRCALDWWNTTLNHDGRTKYAEEYFPEYPLEYVETTVKLISEIYINVTK